MADPVRVFVSHHHSSQEDAFTTRLVADLKAAGGRPRRRIPAVQPGREHPTSSETQHP